MVKATACSFNKTFGADNWLSNNITLTCLDPNFWQRSDFNNVPGTVGYFPKPNYYLYTTGGHFTLSQQLPTTARLIYLGNTKDNTAGVAKTYAELKKSTAKDWGNPFYHHYLNSEEVTIWSHQQPPAGLPGDNINPAEFTQVTTPYFIKCRYNPEKDKGERNQIYLVSNVVQTSWDPPQNPNITLSGFPLYDIMWGYIDWQEKVHDVQQILDTQLVVIRSDVITPKLQEYIVIDQEFLDGFSAYKSIESIIKVTDYDKQHWHPRAKNQLKTLNRLALTGQSCPRFEYDTYMQAEMGYTFRFNWGGCPKKLRKTL